MAVEETGPSSVPEAPPPESPGVASRNDFASSAALVNDILASRPAGDTPTAATAPVNAAPGVDGASEPSARPSGMAASSDFFASVKTKKLSGRSSGKLSGKVSGKPPKKASGKPFWQKQLALRRSGTGDH